MNTLQDVIASVMQDISLGLYIDPEIVQNIVIQAYGKYMYPGIRELPLDQPLQEKTNLREMGCDGGFDPIPPQQIEFDVSLTPLERFVALIRAGVEFYAYSGPAELQVGKNPATRWGFVHLDQTGEPNTLYYGLHLDMVHYLTDALCQYISITPQDWMQRGDSKHIQYFVDHPSIGEELLLTAFFGEMFPELVKTINQGNPERYTTIAALSDQIDNARLCEFSDEIIQQMETQFAEEVRAIP